MFRLPLSQAHQDFLVFSMSLMGDHLLGHFELLLLTQVVYLYISSQRVRVSMDVLESPYPVQLRRSTGQLSLRRHFSSNHQNLEWRRGL